MADSRKISQRDMLSRLTAGSTLLHPLEIVSSSIEGGPSQVDARLDVRIPGEASTYCFIVESKARATPQLIQSAMAQVRKYLRPGEWPLIQVPYLSPERLVELEQAGVSGVDLCGNGIVVVPGRLYVLRTGAENKFPDSRPLNNPYRGRSAMVARMFLREPRWTSLSALAQAINDLGASLSLPQISKAVQAMAEDLIVVKDGGRVSLLDSLSLLDHLGREWRTPDPRARSAFRLPGGKLDPKRLSQEPSLRWAVTGESSVTRYATFSQGGPRRIAVSNLALAQRLLEAVPEPIASFADAEFIESDEPGYYFNNEIDQLGMRWASRLQTWLELQCGDARQQDAAREVRLSIINKQQP